MKIDDLTIHQGHGEKFLTFVLDAVKSGILILDKDGKIVFSNQKAGQLLMPCRPLEGMTFYELFPKEDRRVLARNIFKIAESKGDFEGDVMLLRGDGQGFIARIALSVWHQDEKAAYVVTLSDLSRLKDVERMLHNSERMIYLGQMLDDISHQIRNPVLSIGGFARRLMTTRLERPEYVKVILEEAGRLELLLDVLTRFIQLPKPSFSLYKAQTVIDMVAELARQICDRFNISLKVSTLYDSERKVVTDLALLKKAAQAVVINSCESFEQSVQGALVQLGFEQASKSPWSLRISVKDQGEGIRPPIMDRIFHPFFTTKTGHLGMGLTFTKRILDEIGGRIRIESALGKGTTSVIELPGDRRRKIRSTPLAEENREG